jgi:hypothetical protein
VWRSGWPRRGKHSKPVRFILGKVPEFRISDFDDIDLHHACWRWDPNTGRAGLCYAVVLQEDIKLGRFSSSPAVGSVKVTSGPVCGAEPTENSEAADDNSLASGSGFKLGNGLDDRQHGSSSQVHGWDPGHLVRRAIACHHTRRHGRGGCQPSRISRPRPGSRARSRATNSGWASGHGSLVNAHDVAC